MSPSIIDVSSFPQELFIFVNIHILDLLRSIPHFLLKMREIQSFPYAIVRHRPKNPHRGPYILPLLYHPLSLEYPALPVYTRMRGQL